MNSMYALNEYFLYFESLKYLNKKDFRLNFNIFAQIQTKNYIWLANK